MIYPNIFASALVMGGLLFAATLTHAVEDTTSSTPSKGIPIGIQGLPDDEDPASWAEAEAMQLNFINVWVSWTEPNLQDEPWSQPLENDAQWKRMVALKKKGFTIQVINGIVHMDQKHLPAFVEGKRFNDPELLDRWERYLIAFIQRYGSNIDFFCIGNEVDMYFNGHMEEWPDYCEFVKRGSDVLHREKPGLKTGVILTAKHAARFWKDVEPYCDYLGSNYYTPCSTFEKKPTADALDPNHEQYFARHLDNILKLAGNKPVLFSEIGCATHPDIDSSPALQARFISMLFSWLRGKENKLLAVAWLSISDWPYEGTRTSLKGFLDDKFLEHESFMHYLTSLGLKYEDGTPKPGYQIFKEEVAQYKSEFPSPPSIPQ